MLDGLLAFSKLKTNLLNFILFPYTLGGAIKLLYFWGLGSFFTCCLKPKSLPQPGALASEGPNCLMRSHLPYNARIFVTTANVGGVTSCSKLGPVDRWIPQGGYDIIGVGLQECTITEKLRSVIHKRIGGKKEYEVFTNKIGDPKIGHGSIVLLLFVKKALVDAKIFVREDVLKDKVHSGFRVLGIYRMPNKGVVGMACKFHDFSLAFVCAHFCADKYGKSNTANRNLDAARMLQEMILSGEDGDWDAHQQFHVMFLLGDLNCKYLLVFGGAFKVFIG